MALIADGVTPTQLLAVDNSFKALRASIRPPEHGTGGHYRLSRVVALAATQNANGTLFSFRWGSSTLLGIIEYIRISVQQTAAATATIWPRFQVFAALGASFTASDTAGTQVTLTGNNMKQRQSYATTAVTDIRYSTAAAGLTAGTRTLNADPIMDLSAPQLITGIPVAAATTQLNPYVQELNMMPGTGVSPLVLAQNEGFIVRGPTTAFGAAGTADLVVDVAWSEVQVY